jgi:hypothetical protein
VHIQIIASQTEQQLITTKPQAAQIQAQAPSQNTNLYDQQM